MDARIERAKTLVLPLGKLKTRKEKTMPETNNTKQRLVTMEVFDLDVFDNITLGKEVTLPEKPTSLSEVVAKFNNDESRLISIIYEGMIKEAEVAAEKDKSGWRKFEDRDNDELADEEYNGKSADPEKKKLIYAAILSFAKVLGYDKSLTPEQKNAKKAQAKEIIKSNPAMMEPFTK
jgi:hypothetical protein